MKVKTGPPTDTLTTRHILVLWCAVSALLLAVNSVAIAKFKFPDPDDVLRLLQVRDWIAGQSWFDVTQYRINPPEGAPMHWSRIVDIPIAAVILIFKPFFGQSVSEIIALTAIPLLTLLVIMFVMARITNKLFDKETAIFSCLIIAITVPVVHQIRPMRIDHHGWQMALAMMAFAAAFDERQKYSGWITGSALALWLNISMEGLPIAAAFMALYAVRWVLDSAQRQRLVHAMAALATASAILYLGTTNSWATMINYCDAMSPVHLAIFAFGAFAIGAWAKLNPVSKIWLCAGFAAISATAAVIIFSVAPQCTAGAFADLDPLVREMWYDRVLEGKPIWDQSLVYAIQILVLPSLALFAIVSMRRRTVSPLSGIQTLTAVFLLVCAFALSLMVERSSAISSLFSIPFVAYFIHSLLVKARTIKSLPKKMGVMMGILLLMVPGQVVRAGRNLLGESEIENHVRVALKCELSDNLNVLDRLPRSTFMTPMDTGPSILLASKHRIVASGHHRNDIAMRDVIRTFTGSPQQAHNIITTRKIRYVAYCPGLYEPLNYAHLAPNGFMAQLTHGNIPTWLVPVTIDGMGGLKIWQVSE